MFELMTYGMTPLVHRLYLIDPKAFPINLCSGVSIMSPSISPGSDDGKDKALLRIPSHFLYVIISST